MRTLTRIDGGATNLSLSPDAADPPALLDVHVEEGDAITVTDDQAARLVADAPDDWEESGALRPVESAARSADGDTGWLPCSFAGAALTLEATAHAGDSETLDVIVETASDDAGADAATLITFTQLVDVGSERKRAAGFDRFYRVGWVMEDSGSDPAVAATATLTSDTTNPDDGDTVTVDDVVYTFRTVLTEPAEADEILIGVDTDATLENLAAAINGDAGEGTLYGTGTVEHPTVSSAAPAADAIVLTAKTAGAAGNAIEKAEDSAHLDFDGAGATFTGGADALGWTFSVVGDAK